MMSKTPPLFDYPGGSLFLEASIVIKTCGCLISLLELARGCNTPRSKGDYSRKVKSCFTYCDLLFYS